MMKKLRYLFLIICFFSIRAVLWGQVDVCISVSGNQLHIFYTASQDYSTSPDNLWNSQVITVRYPSSVSVDWSNLNATASLSFEEDPSTIPAVNGGDGFFYKKFSSNNVATPFVLPVNTPTEVMNIEFSASESVSFEAITGVAWTDMNNGTAAVNHAIYFNIFNTFTIGCGTQTFIPDADEDGLSDEDEALAGTNPNLMDTDGDGEDDLLEVGPDAVNPLDGDEDGIPDALESDQEDADQDGVSDEADPSNDDPCIPLDTDTDQDGICDVLEDLNGSNKNNPCDPLDTDTDQDGICDVLEDLNETDKDDICSPFIDTDQDGICDALEDLNETDKNNPCDPLDTDTDQDGICDVLEDLNETDKNDICSPFIDTDQDGICDAQEILDDTNPNDPCDPISQSDICGLAVAPKVFLQGAYYQSVNPGLMRDDLRTAGLIPNVEPYSALTSFTHLGPSGGGSEVIANGVLDVAGSDAIVDWVFVELRNAATPTQVIATRSALLQRDGEVVDVDGISDVQFPGVLPGNYHVVVRHRNHLGVMTANPEALSSASVTLDFSNGATPASGTNAQKMLADGKLALWAGDTNGDRIVFAASSETDITAITASVLTDPANTTGSLSFPVVGYLTADVDMNGKVIMSGAEEDTALITQNILLHPGNTEAYSVTHKIEEQTP